MSSIQVDRYDLEILNALQRDGRATNGTIGEKIHLSTSQVSRRIQRLEEAQVIGQYAALLNAEIVGLGVEAFTFVTLGRHGDRHGDSHAESFERAVTDMPQVLECISVTGESDYIVRVVAPDLATFSDFMMKKLLRLPGVINVKSTITLKKVKGTHVLPLDHITQPAQTERRLVFNR
ncbi:Lrp/AsnC family transcriptional regulator [Noviherbaspirillum galbum]|uniref:Lrp/AsnC family transcriptional regulator n=1 Tax=Noviherbaspirillum galbum TaxID=2709383 RepID=A0A6B3SQM6_9BURK|nr:Lrp/AsnC family transcriptional regulator [Noviherbaspirillum galbum]NEX63074.1 Lrp/AsnC family transcriptional regulator [Noviherbaspirillum galbum]